MKEKKLIVIQGLPGSGKSTLAEMLAPTGAICTTDDYEGLYTFGEKVVWNGMTKRDGVPLIAHAHHWNQSNASCLMQEGVAVVVVPNTNTQRWEFEPYINMAKEHGYEIVVISLFDGGLTDKELSERNTHGVTEKTIARMRKRYEHDWRNGNPVSPH